MEGLSVVRPLYKDIFKSFCALRTNTKVTISIVQKVGRKNGSKSKFRWIAIRFPKMWKIREHIQEGK
jgi:hypothetical protein